MRDHFYRAFEERYYAPREVIKALRKQYLPFVTPLTVAYGGAQTFDIGCGRGEWLELMAEIGFKPYGVDLDEGMLQACKDRGLPAEMGDAVEYLCNLPSESQVVVTAFHVVEHLSFLQLRSVVSEAHRVLKPGGLLIMETPNPENIVVATQNFYLDPTHQRPIPWQLLSYIPEYYGFMRVKTLRLQEDKHLLQKIPITLQNVISGASPDYAVIAQKTATDEILHLLDQAYEGEYGLSLDTIVDQYQKQTISNVQESEKTAKEAMTIALQAETKAQQAETVAQQAETKAQQAETVAQQAERALNLLYLSRSWRITAPLRWLNLQLKLLRQNGLKSRTIALIQKILNLLMQRSLDFIRVRPNLNPTCISVLKKIRLFEPIRVIYHKLSKLHHQTNIWRIDSGEAINPSIAHLTPRGRTIYFEIKTAIKKQKDSFR